MTDLFIRGLKTQRPMRLGLRDTDKPTRVTVFDNNHKFLRFEPPTFWDSNAKKAVRDNGYEGSNY